MPPAGTAGATLLRSPADPLVALRSRACAPARRTIPPARRAWRRSPPRWLPREAASRAPTARFWRLSTRWPRSLDGSCHKEITVFSGVVHRDNLAAYIPIATEMIAQPRFDPADFERLRNEAIDYVTKFLRGNNDEALGKWTLQTELYKDHPYGHPDIGTAQGLKSITLDDVKEFHRRHYSRKSLRVGLAGGFDPEHARTAFAAAFAIARRGEPGLHRAPRAARRSRDWISRSSRSRPKRPRSRSASPRRDAQRRRLLCPGAREFVPGRASDVQRQADAGPSRQTRPQLRRLLVYRRLHPGRRIDVSRPNNPRRQQYFSIWIRPVPADKAVFALRAALWELDRLVENGMSREDFETTRSFLLNYSKLWVQTSSRRLGYAIDGEFYGRRDLVTELADRLPKLTVEEVNAAVRKHLKTDGIKVAIVAKDAAATARAAHLGQAVADHVRHRRNAG